MRKLNVAAALGGLLAGGSLLCADTSPKVSQPVHLPFYVFHGSKSPDNHYAPSGWMGDYGDLKLNDHYADKTVKTHPVLQIGYSAKGSQGAGWAGIFWQNPPNNWGSRPGGYNLTGAHQLTFKARGDKGGEIVAEFKVGGISGDYSDSGQASITSETLAATWKTYTIDVKDQDMSSIIGGFCLTFKRDDNPQGATVYLDDIHYE